MTPVDASPTPGLRRDWAPHLGLALGLSGLVLYGLVIYGLGAYMPAVRNNAVPSWLLITAGLALSTVGVRRAWARPRRPDARGIAGTAFGANLIFAAMLAWILYAATDLPTTSGPDIDIPAPSFALEDQHGATVRLADFRGAPLLLVFYRGHW